MYHYLYASFSRMVVESVNCERVDFGYTDINYFQLFQLFFIDMECDRLFSDIRIKIRFDCIHDKDECRIRLCECQYIGKLQLCGKDSICVWILLYEAGYEERTALHRICAATA